MRWVAAAAALALLALPARANEPACNPFDTSNLTESQAAQVDAAASRTFFPCERLDFSGQPRQDIVVFVRELGGAQGRNEQGLRIDIDDDVSPRRFPKVLLHEYGHSVDELYLTAQDRRSIQRILDAPCWDGCRYENRGSERFADAFVEAFSDVGAPFTVDPQEALAVADEVWL